MKTIAAGALVAVTQVMQTRGNDLPALRPARPSVVSSELRTALERPQISEIQTAIVQLREQQRALREQNKIALDELRRLVRLQAAESKPILAMVRQELSESLAETRLIAVGQARKIAEEMKEVAASAKRKRE